jgi:hypothetical protein
MEPSEELREFTLRLYQAMSSDATEFVRHISQQPGVVVIGTAPNEWWNDYAAISRIFKIQFEELGGLSIADANPQAYRAGSVGWVADQPTLHLANGMAVPFRLTVVFVKEPDGWKIVQWHASIAVGSEESVGQEVTV